MAEVAGFDDALSVDDFEITAGAHLSEWEDRKETAGKRLAEGEDTDVGPGPLRELARPLASGLELVLTDGKTVVASHYLPKGDFKSRRVIPELKKAQRRRKAANE